MMLKLQRFNNWINIFFIELSKNWFIGTWIKYGNFKYEYAYKTTVNNCIYRHVYGIENPTPNGHSYGYGI